MNNTDEANCELDDVIQNEITHWHAQHPLNKLTYTPEQDKKSADFTIDVTKDVSTCQIAAEIGMDIKQELDARKGGLPKRETNHNTHEYDTYTSQHHLTYQQISEHIDKHDPLFDLPRKIGQPTARRSHILGKNNMPKKERFVLIRKGNTITNQMAVQKQESDETIILWLIAEPTHQCYLPAELATTLCTHGLIFQLRQGIMVPKTKENIISN